jgi:hypothetical protein
LGEQESLENCGVLASHRKCFFSIEHAYNRLAILTTLIETLGLIHVHLFIHVSVEESTIDIGPLAIKVEISYNSYKRENNLESGEFHGRSKCLIEV